MTIHVHIERIVLDGIDPGPGQLPHLKAAIEQELGLLMADSAGAAPLRGAAIRSVAGGALDMAGAPATPELGRRVAQATFEGIQRGAVSSDSEVHHEP